MEVELHPCQIVHVETVLFTLPHSVPCKNPFTIFDNDSMSELKGFRFDEISVAQCDVASTIAYIFGLENLRLKRSIRLSAGIFEDFNP